MKSFWAFVTVFTVLGTSCNQEEREVTVVSVEAADSSVTALLMEFEQIQKEREADLADTITINRIFTGLPKDRKDSIIYQAVQNKHYTPLLEQFYQEKLRAKGLEIVKGSWQNSLDKWREILDDYFEDQFEFSVSEISIPQGEKYERTHYVVQLLGEGEKVLYCRLYKSLARNKQEVLFEVKYSGLTEFLQTYKQAYNRVVGVSDFFDTDATYGSHCGITGENPPLRERLDQAMFNQDTFLLYDWISSPTPEKQLYAFEGLYWLDSHGMELPSHIKRSMHLASRRSVMVNECNGCMGMKLSFQELLAQIQEEYKPRR